MTTDDPDDWSRRLDDLHDAVSGKWALHVLRALADGPAGFGALAEATGAPEKSLARRLRELRCRGLIAAEYVPDSPPRRRYRLTAAGRRLVSLLRDVGRDVEYVDCSACEDDCRVATLDREATRQVLAECC